MEVLRHSGPRVVEQYLHASCFNKISQKALKRLLDYESNADPVEKQLIKRVKDQIREGKIVLSVQAEE